MFFSRMYRSVMAKSTPTKFCTSTHRRDVVIYLAWHRNWFRGFGWVGCEIWLLPLTLALASNTAYCATAHTHDKYGLLQKVAYSIMSVTRVTILSTVQCLFSASARGVARHGLGVLKPSQYQTPLKHPYRQMKAYPLNEWASVLAAGILITPATLKSEDLLSYTHTRTHTQPI